jgi:hypothetical protein
VAGGGLFAAPAAADTGLPPVPTAAKGFAVPFDELPPGAVKATRAPFAPGAYGDAFQSVAKAGGDRTRVVGGALANSADHPGVVGIVATFVGYDENDVPGWYTSTCTGTVLSPTKVLTAAHCTTFLPRGTIQVIAGRNDVDVNTGGFVARVASVWTHQGFNLEAQIFEGAVPVDDVAVLTLKDALPSAYTPVALSAQGDQSPYAAGTPATIVGYGVTHPDNNAAGVLHAASVPMVSDSDCAGEYGTNYDANRMVCAGTVGIDTCPGDSGGPIFVGGAQVGITDWGARCGTTYGVYERISYYATLINQDLGRHGLVNLDWSGDGHSDLFGRMSDGRLLQVSGSGLASLWGGIASYDVFGTGWQGYNKIFRVTNWNGDGNPSIMARDKTGRLYQYRSNGRGGFVGGKQLIGTGWNAFSDIMVTNNWMGDGRPNLMGRKPNGDLVIYTSNGKGGWTNPRGTLIGTGWNAFNTVLTPGSWKGDGRQSLIGRKSNGDLILYTSNGKGGFSGRGVKIGSGWNSFRIFMSPGDWNGDNMIDLVGVTPAGAVRLYTTNGRGGWIDGRGKQIDTGWNIFNTVF